MAADAAPSGGLLHGLPIGVKDIIDSDDMPCLWGDATTYAGRRPSRNAPVVQRIREERGFVLGKTAVSRFGYWWPGKTRNPHNIEHSPGTSSSGSAAAVADFMCPLAIGTQTGGSIVRPAVYCGVVGFKPTHDLIAWRHIRDYAPTFDVVGGFSRSVEDMLFLMRDLPDTLASPTRTNLVKLRFELAFVGRRTGKSPRTTCRTITIGRQRRWQTLARP